MLTRAALALVLLAGFTARDAAPAQAQSPAVPAVGSLKPGDPAPPLGVSTWLKGEPVPAFEPGKTYVIMLAATWTPLFREGIAGLNAVNRRLSDRGVKLVVVSVYENSRTAAETFAKLRGQGIEFSFGVDDVPAPPAGRPDDREWASNHGRTAVSWLRAAGRDTLPAAFIVDARGRLAWFGHPTYPRGETEEAVRLVLGGELTPDKAAEISRWYQERQQRFEAAEAKLRTSTARRDHKTASEAVGELIEIAEPHERSGLYALRMQILLTHLSDERGAKKLAEDALEGPHKGDPQVLNAVAWTMMDAVGVAKRDYALAQRLAEEADRLAEHKIAPIIGTLARAHFEQGKLDEAIEIQTRAIELQKRIVAEFPDYVNQKTLLGVMEDGLRRYTEARAKKGGG
ncbi:MAG: hypothetical protein ACKVU4_14940 [Phycisphaerales bacterium]